MTVETRTVKTKAEEALAAQFDSARLPGGAVATERRAAAFRHFARVGLPHRRVEAWKYTDLRALMRLAQPLAGAPDVGRLAGLLDDDALKGLERARIVIVNGVFQPGQSDLDGIDGVTVEPLVEVLEKSPERVGALFADSEDAMLALNTAMMQGGVVVTVARDAAPARPIEIAHLSATAEPASTYPHSVVTVGDNASVRFLETHHGPAGTAYQVNAVIELDVGPGAKVTWARLQAEGGEAEHVTSFVARVAKDASLHHLVANAGARLWRWQGFVKAVGSGVDLRFNGATMLSGREHGDTSLVLDHAEPHGISRELFKNVVDDEASGAFQGRIEVRQGAQKTDAKMMSQALLLTDTGEFDAKPELEIFADDVQCGHGATSGRIDDTMLFYLMARGIPRPVAERLLIEAFLADAVDSFGDEQIGAALRRTITGWLARRGAKS